VVTFESPVSTPEAYFLARVDMDRLLGALAEDGRRVIGPTVADGAIVLDEIRSASDLPIGWAAESRPGGYRLRHRSDARAFDHAVGPMSWKRWTFPPRLGSQDVAPLAFVGVRACEIAALRIQDRVLEGGPAIDQDYRARRAAAIVVAVECATALDTCFCTSMGTGPEVESGFDLALTELDEGYVVRTGSTAGEGLVAALALEPANAAQRVAAADTVRQVRERIGDPLPTEGLPARLIAAAEHPRWTETAERCLACANCTLVCPTCFCNSPVQRSDLDGGNASVERTWDSCFTFDFARVAGGNFRPRTRDRYRQWLTHKFGTWWDQFGSSGCVGCGRCIAWCPVAIDVREELMAIAPPPMEASMPLAVVPGVPAPAHTVPPAPLGADLPTTAPGSAGPTVFPAFAPPPTLPERYVEVRVVSSRHETHDVVTLRLATDDPALLACRPGQFVMAWRPAFAGPPISVSRVHPDGFELTIRAAGPATTALTRLERGASVLVRGPLGRGWPVDAAVGCDVVVVTGGIGLAPLRPLLDTLLAERERFGRVRLAYGARTPADRLFVDELDALARDGRIEVDMTVDRAGPEWFGRVGVVTQLIDTDACGGRDAVAFVCGPERMMAATADVLAECGVPPERVFVTLERHMDCGVGLCGHCQLGRFFVCRDGPVFSLAELGPALRLEGL
jgi:NAD(P)H-flavin reductase/Pyruvate/2-oxoacid:ferredoxin oxidoreductase delta subunit